MVEENNIEEKGRRIYLHEESLLNLLLRNINKSDAVVEALVKMMLIKSTHHTLTEPINCLGIDRSISDAFLVLLERIWQNPMSRVFHRIGYIPQDSQRRKDFLHILAPHELILGSCYDQGYYTFATSSGASKRMYLDNEPLKSLKRSVRLFREPSDLTMISGNRLCFINKQRGCGTGMAYFYRNIINANPIESKVFFELETKIVRRVCDEFLEIVSDNPISEGFLSAAQTICKLRIRQGVFL